MKKTISFIKQYDLDIIVVTIIIVAIGAFFIQLNDSDELWNFANAYKMFEGYQIYKDLNVIITPLFFYIAQIFFKLFGATMLSFRIYNVLISSVFMILIYKIFKTLKIVRRRAIFYTFIIEDLFFRMITGGANYNILVIIPILVNLLLIFKNKENDILTGILLWITFMIKQNVFVYFAIGIFAYKISTNGLNQRSIVSLLKIYLISAIGIFAFILQMYFTHNLYSFVNYCILGIAEFGKENVGIAIYDSRFVIIFTIIAIFILIIINHKKTKLKIEKQVIKNLKILLCFGIPLILIAYPIVNYYHSTLASIIVMISFIYMLENIFLKEVLENVTKEKTLYVIIIIIYMLDIVGLLAADIANNIHNYVFVKDGPFYGTITTKENEEDVAIICNYIATKEKEGINVKILSYKANLYMLPLEKNNGIFDLAFFGNMGKEGENGLINEISQLKNTFLLIPTDEKNVFQQESKKVRQYIINSYEKIGEIQEYSIYKIGM